VHCELTQLTEKLRENESARSSLTSQLQAADIAVADGTKRVRNVRLFVIRFLVLSFICKNSFSCCTFLAD